MGYDESMRSSFDRQNIFDVPTYTDMIAKVKAIPDTDDKKIALGILVATGCRVSEILRIKKSHIKFFSFENKELTENFGIDDIHMVQLNLYTEKNRNTKYRIVPLIKNDLFYDLVKLIFEQWQSLEFNDSYICQTNRIDLWRKVKKVFGKDYYPHFLRHSSVTNDTRAGINPAILKSKYGWTDLRPHTVYSHLNYNDLLEAQERVFGIAKRAKEVIPSVDTVPIEKQIIKKTTEIAKFRIDRDRGRQQQFAKRPQLFAKPVTTNDIPLI